MLLATRNGKALRFASRTKEVWKDPNEDRGETEGRWEKKVGVRPMGRVAAGVRGIRLLGDDEVVSMAVLNPEEPPQWYVDWKAAHDAAVESDDEDDGPNVLQGEDDYPDVLMLTITENGYGKRSPVAGKYGYRLISRGNQGVRNIDKIDRAGQVVGTRSVVEGADLIVVTDGGKLIRTAVDTISKRGRATMGVKVIRLAANEKVVSFDLLVESDDEDEEDAVDAVEGAATAEGADAAATAESAGPADTEPTESVDTDADAQDEV